MRHPHKKSNEDTIRDHPDKKTDKKVFCLYEDVVLFHRLPLLTVYGFCQNSSVACATKGIPIGCYNVDKGSKWK